jgi:ParB-like chromosome segregation protein Spo0J
MPEPICVESQGSLILADGHHRLAALAQLAREHPGDRRFEFISVRVANTPSGQLPAAYAYEIALACSAKGPLPLTRAEKHAAIARLLVEHPEWSDREIARRVGVDNKTVGSLRKLRNSSADDGSLRDRNGAAASTSPARVARIAAQIVRYGVELGAEGSDVEYDEIVAVLADRFRELHPRTARNWVEWWEGIWRDVRAELEAGA